MKLKGDTPNALLGLLTLHPMSGYDIRQLIPESIGHFWSESYGQIYPALKALTTEGLVVKKTERKRGRPDRNVYSLTDAGREQLTQWLEIPVAPSVPRNELLLKVFFGAHAAPSVIREQVLAHRQGHQAAMELYSAMVHKLGKNQIEDPQLPYWLMTLSYGRRQSEAIVVWCDETLKQLDKLEKQSQKKS